MKVLLVGNYEPDLQWSMQRFANMLLPALREEGIDATLVRPAAVIGHGNKWLGYVDKFFLFRARLNRSLQPPPHLVHILDQGNAIYASWLARSILTLITCHDLLALRSAKGEFPAHPTSATGRVLQNQIFRGLCNASHLVSVSAATQRDAGRLIGESTVIPNGVDDFWRPVAFAKKNYLLHVGGSQWYKNREAVIRSFIALRKGTRHAPRLVMAGPALDMHLTAALNEAGLAGEVTTMQNPSDEALRVLYSEAQVFVFPSLAEGFGWPILEAQACGCPVVTIDADPMRETAGRAAILSTEAELAKALGRVLDLSAGERAALIADGQENARKYSVKKMAQAYAVLYQSLVE